MFDSSQGDSSSPLYIGFISLHTKDQCKLLNFTIAKAKMYPKKPHPSGILHSLKQSSL